MDSWQFMKPEWWIAWTWLLLSAEWREFNPFTELKRGQLKFSVTRIPKIWRMGEKAARNFLSRCEQEGDIIWNRGRGGWRKPHAGQDAGQEDTQDAGQIGIITICNYEFYQPLFGDRAGQDAGQDAGQEDGSYKKREEGTKKRRKSSRPPGDTRIKILIDYFHDRHIQTKGDKPHIVGGRDATAIKRMLKTCSDVEQFKKRIDRFLEDPLVWMTDGKQWTIPILEKCFQKYARSPKKEQKAHWEVEDEE